MAGLAGREYKRRNEEKNEEEQKRTRREEYQGPDTQSPSKPWRKKGVQKERKIKAWSPKVVRIIKVKKH